MAFLCCRQLPSALALSSFYESFRGKGHLYLHPEEYKHTIKEKEKSMGIRTARQVSSPVPSVLSNSPWTCSLHQSRLGPQVLRCQTDSDPGPAEQGFLILTHSDGPGPTAFPTSPPRPPCSHMLLSSDLQLQAAQSAEKKTENTESQKVALSRGSSQRPGL